MMRHPSGRTERTERSRRRRLLAAFLGASAVAAISYGATNWIVGLQGGSSGEGKSGTVTNLSISAVASPTPGNLLYPGGTGDVVVSISNPNPFPVTITAVNLPTNTTYATGYTTSSLTTTQTGCVAATPSGVTWSFATGSSGSSHTLTTPLVVAASGQSDNPLVVTLTNDASMSMSAPAACEDTYFSLPSLTGVSASAGGTPTTSPATDSWTS
jgi:hypothetical protein